MSRRRSEWALREWYPDRMPAGACRCRMCGALGATPEDHVAHMKAAHGVTIDPPTPEQRAKWFAAGEPEASAG